LNSSTLSKELLSVFKLWLCPAFWSQDMTMHLGLSAFTSSPISLLATTKASAFSFIVCTLPPILLTSLAYTTSWCVPINLKASWFTWTLLMAYCKPELKAMPIGHLLVSSHPNSKHVRQKLVYSVSAIGFIQTHFFKPYQFHGDTKLNVNIIQDLSPNWIISFLEVFNPLALELDIYSSAHHLCKMWIFYEPRRVTLGNTWHFLEE